MTVALLAGLLAGCASPLDRVTYQFDYPAYSDLAQLCQAASTVVVGTPISTAVMPVDILSSDQGDSAEENPALGAEQPPSDSVLIETVTTLRVDEVISGDEVEPGDMVRIGQPGGVYGGVEYVSEQQYPTREGETHLLFLETFPDAPASLLNPGQAGFAVSGDGTISPESASSLADQLAGRTVSADLCA